LIKSQKLRNSSLVQIDSEIIETYPKVWEYYCKDTLGVILVDADSNLKAQILASKSLQKGVKILALFSRADPPDEDHSGNYHKAAFSPESPLTLLAPLNWLTREIQSSRLLPAPDEWMTTNATQKTIWLKMK
jgi:hypothetical protein